VKTCCGHRFCERCLRLSLIAMLDRSESASCPLCRQPLTSDDDFARDPSVTVRMRRALADKHRYETVTAPASSRTGKVIRGRSPLPPRARPTIPSDENDLATFLRDGALKGSKRK
jgi:hypothetical protein